MHSKQSCFCEMQRKMRKCEKYLSRGVSDSHARLDPVGTVAQHCALVRTTPIRLCQARRSAHRLYRILLVAGPGVSPLASSRARLRWRRPRRHPRAGPRSQPRAARASEPPRSPRPEGPGLVPRVLALAASSAPPPRGAASRLLARARTSRRRPSPSSRSGRRSRTPSSARSLPGARSSPLPSARRSLRPASKDGSRRPPKPSNPVFFVRARRSDPRGSPAARLPGARPGGAGAPTATRPRRHRPRPASVSRAISRPRARPAPPPPSKARTVISSHPSLASRR